MKTTPGPIGIFDSGYGGLTVLTEIKKRLPDYDYIYLGDNARAPYGSRSFETVYEYTRESVIQLFKMGCHLVILACNTASAKALRTIQQRDLPKIDPLRRVLGVIRPTTEIVGQFSGNREIGILGTTGTVSSNSYVLEIARFFPDIVVHQEACPMWVPLIENRDFDNEGGDFFIKKHCLRLLEKSSRIDAVVLACTHYPIILPQIRRHIPREIQIISQGPVVAAGLEDYLRRHREIEMKCTKGGRLTFYTTDESEGFNAAATLFYGQTVTASHLSLH